MKLKVYGTQTICSKETGKILVKFEDGEAVVDTENLTHRQLTGIKNKCRTEEIKEESPIVEAPKKRKSRAKKEAANVE